MKKIKIALTLSLLLAPFFALADIDSISQTSIYTGHYQATGVSGFADPQRGYFFTSPSAHGTNSPYGIGNVTLPQDVNFSAAGFGTYNIVTGNANGDCLNMNLAGCEASMISNFGSYNLYQVTYAPTPVPDNFTSMLGTGTTTFQNSFGFSIKDSLTWAWTNLYSLVIGSGLGVLKLLVPFIIVLAIIVCIVYFLYRAFRFFRH